MTATIKDLGKNFADEQTAKAILSILGVDPISSVRHNEKARRIEIDFMVPVPRFPGLIKGNLRLAPQDWQVAAIAPRLLSPGKSQVLLMVKPSTKPGDSLPFEIEWEVAGQKYVQPLPLPLPLPT